jgi:hypothetical protein
MRMQGFTNFFFSHRFMPPSSGTLWSLLGVCVYTGLL